MRLTFLQPFAACIAVSLLVVTAVACGDDSESTDGGGGGATSTSTGNDENGILCGDDVCDPAVEFCGFASGRCDGAQTCQPYPACGGGTVCGCDGESYTDTCGALELAGGVADVGACPAPAGEFTCTYEDQLPIYCELGAEYCRVTPSGGVYDLDCVPLPDACVDPPTDCACTNDPCAETYCGVDDETGAITVLCPLTN